jgi:hypothetical protein
MLDTADLPPQAARELVELVDAAERSASSAPAGARRGVPDAMRYDLTIMREGRVRRLSFDDTTVPPDAGPLLERLLSQGRPRSRPG